MEVFTCLIFFTINDGLKKISRITPIKYYIKYINVNILDKFFKCNMNHVSLRLKIYSV